MNTAGQTEASQRAGIPRCWFAGFIVFLLCFKTTPALPAQSIWTNLTSGAWGTAGNWSPAAVPNAVGAVVTITNQTIVLTNTGAGGTYPYTFGTLQYLASSGSVGFGTLSASEQLTAQVASGSPTFYVPNSPASIYFYVNLLGTQGFTKTGAGKLTFRYNSQVQAYAGSIVVSAGTLGIQQDSSLGNANNDLVLSNGAYFIAEPSANAGTVTLASTRTVTLAGVSAQIGVGNAAVTLVIPGGITESFAGASLVFPSSGGLTLSGPNNYGGSTTISSGTLTIGGAGQLGSGDYAASITNNGVLNYNSSANQILTGVISGNGALTQSGTGTLTLSGANTYSGATTINAGTLALGVGGTLAANSSMSIAAGATFDVSGLGASASYTFGSSATLTASGSSSAASIKGAASGTINLGSRPITLNFDGANPSLVISQGALSLSGQAVRVNVSSPLPNGIYRLIKVAGGNLAHSGNYPLAGTATNGTVGSTLGFVTNAGIAYLQMNIAGSTNSPAVIPNLLCVVSSNNYLNLSWPADHLGWILWAQTNTLNKGLGANWYALPYSVTETSTDISMDRKNAAVFFRLTYGDYGSYHLTNMLTNWDGHYELANANIPPSSSVTNISNTTYTWKIVRDTNSFSFVVDNEGSGPILTNGTDLKSRSELYVPLHLYTNGKPNLVAYHINYVIPPLTDYGSNNTPFWAMQIYHASGKPICFLGLAAPYQGVSGAPSLGVYTNMQVDGTTTGATQYPFKLLNSPFTTLGDVRSTNGFTLSVNLDFSTNATASVTAQIVLNSNPTNIYQAVCLLPLQSSISPFNDGTEMYLKFGSYNAGGLHHHAKVSVSYFDIWSSAPLPANPVRGVGTYYIPALQRQISAGNYNNLGIN